MAWLLQTIIGGLGTAAGYASYAVQHPILTAAAIGGSAPSWTAPAARLAAGVGAAAVLGSAAGPAPAAADPSWRAMLAW